MKFAFLLFIVGAVSGLACAQTFDVDFARPSNEPPLVKTKFGVYQTPLVTLPRLLASIPMLRELNVQHARYEMAWGKPDVLAFDQIGGTPTNLTYDFSMIDAWVGGLKSVGVQPLLALSYDPTPLQTRTEWARWKDLPSNLDAWSEINRAYAAHLQTLGACADYEVWNEPDMPEPNDKMFFSGNAADYGRLYGASVKGVKSGDADAPVGGPAAAYDLAFLAPLLDGPLDFASIHGYDNYAGQVAGMRDALKTRPDVPIWLTEYASFTDLPANGPQSRHAGAMRFFRDVKGLLNLTDVTRVYWAQWLDAGDAPGMGLVSFDGHRKAIYNAFEIYGLMPVDRNWVAATDAKNLDAMASSDAHRASVVIWNSGDVAQNARVNLRGLPFESGVLQTFRIDGEHASWVDNAASETLRPTQTEPFRGARERVWQGEIPAQSVVYLQLSDAKTPPLVAPPTLGEWGRVYYHFSDRNSQTYADFDARTATARLGLDNESGAAQIGVILDDPAPRVRVQVQTRNRQVGEVRGVRSLLAVRVDYRARDGRYTRGTLFHDGLDDQTRAEPLPWGANEPAPNPVYQRKLKSGAPWIIDIQRLAPPDWDGKRVRFSFIMRDTGRGSSAKFMLTRG